MYLFIQKAKLLSERERSSTGLFLRWLHYLVLDQAEARCQEFQQGLLCSSNFPGALSGAGLEVEHLGLEPVSIWIASAAQQLWSQHNC